ncbi:MAG: hypothetical protein EOO03_13020 [Chitinophagaceae bacterium]|nr:MAG: hypothetical protein EOO03_13020 [Chitinophagaceae bacterium]
MSKFFLPVILLITFIKPVLAQEKIGPAEQRLMDSLCNDLTKIDMNKISTKKEANDAFMNTFLRFADMALGVAEEHGVEVTDQAAMQKIGLSLGVNLLKQKCSSFIKLAAIMAGTNTEGTTETAQLTSGSFKRIETKGFNYIVINDDKGNEKTFLWLRQFPGSENLIDAGNKLTGKKLKISSQEIEVYLPQAKGYYKVKEITGIELLQ